MSLTNPKRERSLFSLIGDLPGLAVGLVKAELNQLKNELIAKAKKLGIGAGLIAAALFLLFFAFAVFIAAAVLGIATALPAWLAALIVGAALVVIAAILILVGVKSIKSGKDPEVDDTVESIKKDVDAIKGEGHYDRHHA